ncbi:hypothetical protein WG66_011575 [Moniliophthora roreri]|nr:hypothetical protein WG66_011575 [Moniliophthora roreri]
MPPQRSQSLGEDTKDRKLCPRDRRVEQITRFLQTNFRQQDSDEILKTLSSPVPSSLDVSRPSKEILHTFNCLHFAAATSLTRWSHTRTIFWDLWPHICRWTTFLIQNCIIDSLPHTIQGVEFVEHVIYLVQLVSQIPRSGIIPGLR